MLSPNTPLKQHWKMRKIRLQLKKPTQEPTTGDVVAGASSGKPRRQRVSFSKKKLLASPDLFLLPRYLIADKDVVDSVAESIRNCTIQGQISQCPTEKNGKRYIVVWSHTLPVGLNHDMLCTQFSSSPAIKEKLASAIQAYSSSQEQSSGHPPPSQSSNTASPPPSVPRTPAHILLTARQLHNSARMRTSSTVSSLSFSGNSS
jgi:hypothetical protein